MNDRNPYNLDEVIDACAKHAWERREAELRRFGFNGQEEIRSHIAQTVEGQNTLAFSSQPQIDKGQILQREVYNAPFQKNEAEKPYETTIILDPNTRETDGQVYGGSCWIRRSDKKEFQRLVNDETKSIETKPQIVHGGRPALRQQQMQNQVTIKSLGDVITTSKISQNSVDEFPPPPPPPPPDVIDPNKQEKGRSR